MTLPTKIQKAMTRHRLTLKIATERCSAHWDALASGQPHAQLEQAREHMRNAVQAMRRR
jgi:hypothetical protein